MTMFYRIVDFLKDIGMLVTLLLSIIVKETPDFSALKQDIIVLPRLMDQFGLIIRGESSNSAFSFC